MFYLIREDAQNDLLPRLCRPYISAWVASHLASLCLQTSGFTLV